MTDKPIRVGFIGLNPGAHWAATAHIPALNALPNDFVVTGVANTSLASARSAAEAFDLPHAFHNAQALVDSPDVDLVVVTVKVPHHRELVTAALKAGKHVYCEWPLGNGLAEARELADLADAKGVVAAIGTQMRVAPEVEYLRQLIADGYVGEVLSTTLVGSGGPWGGGKTDASRAYLYDKANGATLLSIAVGHTIAGMREVLGDFSDLSARAIRHRNIMYVADTGETIPSTAHDQILVHGALESGAAFSIHYRWRLVSWYQPAVGDQRHRRRYPGDWRSRQWANRSVVRPWRQRRYERTGSVDAARLGL
jgi:predicted dehydrogenase